MLNFAEQTGSGAVMIVWSFLTDTRTMLYMYATTYSQSTNLTNKFVTSLNIFFSRE